MTSNVRVRAISILAIPALLAGSAFAQAKGGTTGAPAGGGTGTTGNPSTGPTSRPTSNTPTQPTQPSQSPVNIPQPIFISGRVMLEDGTPPPEPAVIETVCNGNPHGEGYTDSKGYFSIELGARRGMIMDASEFGSMPTGPDSNMQQMRGTSSGSPLSSTVMESPERKYLGCDLQAKLAGYRSQAVALAGRRPMDDPNIGTILLHRTMGAEEGKTISATSLAAPKDAKKAYEKGLDAIKKKKYEDAQKNFEKAVEVYPKYAAVWYELGMLQMGQGNKDLALKSFNTALENDPKYIRPYLQLAVIALQGQKWQELADLTEKTIKLDPFAYPQAYFFNSVANFNTQHFDAAEKSALEAERLDTRHQYPKNSHLLGMLLAMKKDYPGAAERMKAYLKYAPNAEDAPKVRTQLAEIEKVTAATAGQDHQ
jgi:tetratricopeptide (TPR) repeat protein